MDVYKCRDCFMSFNSPDLLRKHRTKFCVGGSLGDPNHLMLRQGLRSAEGNTAPRPKPPQSRAQSDSGYIDGKVKEVQDLKSRRSLNKELRDKEERLLLRSFNDSAERSPRGRPRDLKAIQDEYNRVKASERHIKRIVDEIEIEAMNDNGRPSPASSMSIYLSDEEYSPRTNKKRTVHNSQMRHLAESHSRQVAGYQSRSKDLEKQREDIRRRLEQLGRVQPADSDVNTQLLQDLRQQERKNEQTLAELKKQLTELSRVKKKPKPKKEPTFSNVPYYGNSLVAEISAMRQSYLQNGGNDQAVLAQMNQMLHEAQLVEAQEKDTRPVKPRESVDGLTQQMLAIELENQNLQRELLMLQQNMLPRKQNQDHDEDIDNEIKKLERSHLRKMTQIQHEMELLKQQAMLEKFKREIMGEGKPTKPSVPDKVVPTEPTADVPVLLQNRQNGLQNPYNNTLDVPPQLRNVPQANDLLPAPYDPNAGFVIFYDFIGGLDSSIKCCRLVAGLYNNTSELGDPSVLPTVYTEPSQIDRYQSCNMALVGAKQPVPQCPPSLDLCIVVELQVSGDSSYDPNRLVSRAWCKIDLFDDHSRVVSGRWRVPFRVVPIRASLPPSQLNSVPQYGIAELFYRVVNHRDAASQSLVNITPQNCVLHQYPPQRPQQMAGIHHYPPTSPPFSPASSSASASFRTTLPVMPRQQLTNGQVVRETSRTLGFRVVSIKNAEAGEGKIRLTVYSRSTGNIIQSASSPMTCTTTYVQSKFKHNYHVFGEQEAVFNGVTVTSDMILVARFYLRRELNEINSGNTDIGATIDESVVGDEVLTAWSVIPLMSKNNGGHRGAKSNDPSWLQFNKGTHSLPLYLPPVPESDTFPETKQLQSREWRRYQRATLRVHLFCGDSPSRSLTPSEASSEDEDTFPENSWISFSRRIHPENPYENQGFDLYIDGARYLPDTVTITRVAARFLNRHYVMYGENMVTGVDPDSLIFHPAYNYKHEVRYTVPPTTTLVLKVYTIDKFTKTLAVVGYGLLNVFIEAGTGKELPTTYKEGIEVALNEGAHQVRLYSEGPNGLDPLHQTILKETGIRHVPCASVLIRIVPAVLDDNGEPLQAADVPEHEWLSKGILRPRPAYNDRVYFSSTCAPTKSEMKLFHAHANRPAITVRDAVAVITSGNRQVLASDDTIQEFIDKTLTRQLDFTPDNPNLSYISRYLPRYGLKVAVDSAMNLPWSNFTYVHMCLNPPGAFYMGVPNASYDKPVFTQKLDLDSNNRSPRWRDGFFHFHHRTYHPNLVVTFHLQEVAVKSTPNSCKYSLDEQAWTAVPVFSLGYAVCDVFQLPLFKGSPNKSILNQIAKEPFKQWLRKSLTSRTIHLVDGASIFVRVCDGRRDDELTPNALQKNVIMLNTDYIPEELDSLYSKEVPGTPLSRLVPPGKTVHEMSSTLPSKMKSLVYKLYQDGHYG